MIKVLVVGQTPPPFLGQAMMIQRLVNASFKDVEVRHVRLAFSEEAGSIGKISLKKVFHLFSTIIKIYKETLFKKDMVLYYPPSGPNMNPIVRDLILLFFIRPLFKKNVFHFRAAGISEYLQSTSKWFQFICKKIYGKPDIGVQLSSLNPADADYFQAKRVFYIPNGLEDDAKGYLPFCREANSTIQILFVGILREDKGLTILINSMHSLMKKGVKNFTLTVMGDFNSAEYEKELYDKIKMFDMKDHVLFIGSKAGLSKWHYFNEADFLVFPTFFNSESFGNVLLEAMMFQLPVIATAWRGTPDIVTPETGFLIPIKNEEALEEKINILIGDHELRLKMGTKARSRFLEYYTLQQHLDKMQSMFRSLE